MFVGSGAAERGEKSEEVRRRRRFEGKGFACGGVRQLEPPGVQHLAAGPRGPGGQRRAVARGRAVDRIARDGAADRGEVDADLVRPPRVQAQAQQRRGAEVLRDLVVGPRGLAAARDERHLLAVSRASADRAFERPARRLGDAARERQIRLADGAGLERGLQRRERGVRLGDREEPRRVAVEAVDDSRAALAADGEDAGAAGQERVHERAVRMARGGVDDEAGGFVHDEHRVVLENDRERNVLRFERGFGGGRLADEVGLAGRGAALGVRAAERRGGAGEGDGARGQEPLDGAARPAGRGREPGVETRAGRGRVRRHGERARFRGGWLVRSHGGGF